MNACYTFLCAALLSWTYSGVWGTTSRASHLRSDSTSLYSSVHVTHDATLLLFVLSFTEFSATTASGICAARVAALLPLVQAYIPICSHSQWPPPPVPVPHVLPFFLLAFVLANLSALASGAHTALLLAFFRACSWCLPFLGIVCGCCLRIGHRLWRRCTCRTPVLILCGYCSSRPCRIRHTCRLSLSFCPYIFSCALFCSYIRRACGSHFGTLF